MKTKLINTFLSVTLAVLTIVILPSTTQAQKRSFQIAKPVFLPILTLPKEAQQYYYFEPQEFLDLFDNMTLPNTTPISNHPNIYLNNNVNDYIYTAAFARGYQLRQSAIEQKLERVEGVKLQQEVAENWKRLQTAAQKEGIYLGIVSGYRSVSDQMKIFKQRFENAFLADTGRNFFDQGVLSGDTDKIIDLVLSTSSVPGTSKHHSGYTLDITDTSTDTNFVLFETTPGYTWISNNNYYNLKRFGFIPSYPDGGYNMGPDPEAWEIVWVGVDKLKL